MTKKRKRLGGDEDDYTRFYDKAHANGYKLLVVRWLHEDQVLLKVMAFRGAHELTAPSVIDVRELADSVADMADLIEREAA